MKKSELQKEYDRVKAELLKREREETREYNIYYWLEDWIYIAEMVWHKMKRLKQYRLKGYNIHREAIFELVMEWNPIYK